MATRVSFKHIGKQLLLGLLVIVTVVGWLGTPRVAASTQTKFINKLGPNALTVSQKYKLYGSVMVAQAIVESGWGKSTLSKTAKNYYGIKGSYHGKSVTMRTAEYSSSGTLYYTNAKFRKYPSIKASMTDNAKTLRNGTAWNHNYYSGTWRANAKTYKQATAALSLRYSTNSAYGTQLNRIISSWNLQRYDKTFAVATYDAYNAYTIMKSSNHRIYSHIVNTRANITSRSSKTYANQIVAIDMKGTKKSGTKDWYRVKAGTKKGWIAKSAVMHTSKLKANVVAAHNKLYKPAVKTQAKTTDSSSSSTTSTTATSSTAKAKALSSSNSESTTESSTTDSHASSSSSTTQASAASESDATSTTKADSSTE
ncbi:glucosaminidase domain-containing protein [Lactiplantibacillus daowaiensis]|uniref:Glucosaminidase domain-containing protein n=1 Tax=Lactiplantibacillus daowaiensis TaxID=2559918 RepID=A0ABW1S032_9LACO|nr:glucosaminidase domain-containing protein [Lactiplantibacillus daowaiensis]